mmetsp:Transcript_38350/g.110063  ORF Transcript_38350/g.110063 Transcript_38350/m.110063 type:complete len:258 (-) Transcript_38350:297-1070(-)
MTASPLSSTAADRSRQSTATLSKALYKLEVLVGQALKTLRAASKLPSAAKLRTSAETPASGQATSLATTSPRPAWRAAAATACCACTSCDKSTPSKCRSYSASALKPRSLLWARRRSGPATSGVGVGDNLAITSLARATSPLLSASRAAPAKASGLTNFVVERSSRTSADRRWRRQQRMSCSVRRKEDCRPSECSTSRTALGSSAPPERAKPAIKTSKASTSWPAAIVGKCLMISVWKAWRSLSGVVPAATLRAKEV